MVSEFSFNDKNHPHQHNHQHHETSNDSVPDSDDDSTDSSSHFDSVDVDFTSGSSWENDSFFPHDMEDRSKTLTHRNSMNKGMYRSNSSNRVGSSTPTHSALHTDFAKVLAHASIGDVHAASAAKTDDCHSALNPAAAPVPAPNTAAAPAPAPATPDDHTDGNKADHANGTKPDEHTDSAKTDGAKIDGPNPAAATDGTQAPESRVARLAELHHMSMRLYDQCCRAQAGNWTFLSRFLPRFV
jgi:hypothetical protein